jgi:hypothetical protein
VLILSANKTLFLHPISFTVIQQSNFTHVYHRMLHQTTMIHSNRKYFRKITLSVAFAITAFTLALTVPQSTSAQFSSYRSFEQWYIGISLGSTRFYGDISGRSHSYSQTNPFSGTFYQNRDFMYGISLTKRFGGVFWTRFNLLNGTLDSEEDDLNLYFKSDIVEFSGHAILNFTEIFLGADPQRPVNVYAYAGLGILSYRAWKRQIQTDSLIDTEGTGSQKALNIIIPLGIGVDYRVNSNFTVTGEFSLRNLRSDRLDAHSSVNTGQEGYGFINVGFHYQFDMPEGMFRNNNRYNGKSSDPAIRAYNKHKSNIMKTEGYREGMRAKRRIEWERKEWLILKLFKKTHLDMATE